MYIIFLQLYINQLSKIQEYGNIVAMVEMNIRNILTVLVHACLYLFSCLYTLKVQARSPGHIAQLTGLSV